MARRGISFAVAILSFALPIFILVEPAPKMDLAGLVFALLFLLWTSVPTAIPWFLVRRGADGPSFRWLFSGQIVSFVLATAFYAKILYSGYDSPFIFFVLPSGFQWLVLAVTMVAAEMAVSGKSSGAS